MLRYSLNGITVATVRDIRKKDPEELCPIRVCVTHKRKQVYYSTGVKLYRDDWQRLESSKSTKLKQVKDDIQMVFEITKNHINSLVSIESFSFENLSNRLGKAVGDTLNTAFRGKIQANLDEDKVSTADWYKYALRSIELFAGGNIEFSQINIEWLKRYEKYLLSENKAYTTVSMYMRALQVVMNDAKTAGIVNDNSHPFGKGKYEIPQHSGRNMALTVAQVGKIVNFECHSKNMEMCRDIWFFSYLCNGANITDILKLKFSNIANGEISFYRQKTLAKSKVKKLIHAILTTEMETIIVRWGNSHTTKESLVFPFLKGGENATDERRIIKNVTHLINDNMQKIGAKIGIPKISTYTARHSFATVLKRSGANIASISESLGHSDVKTTENYLDQFESEERMKNAKSLTNF